MDESDIHDQIAQLEERIEALAGSIERCGKISLAARIAIGAGAAGIVLMLVGVIAFDPSTMVATLAAVLGGIVLLGSNATTWAQTEAELHTAETMRARLIGSIEFRVVGEQTPTIH